MGRSGVGRRSSDRLGLWIAAAVVSATLAGCATAPVEREVTKAQTYGESKDVVWERAVNFFAEHNLSIKTIEKASGIIAAERSLNTPRPNIDGYADCGTPGLYVPALQTIDLNVFIRQLAPDRTSVTVNARFVETRRLGQYPPVVQTCVSTGALETSILSALGKQI